MKNRPIPEAFHPGEYIRMALEEKGWAQLDLAAIMGKPANVVNDILVGRRPISPEIAQALGEIFDNGAQVWLNLQTAYKLAISETAGDLIPRRTKLYNKAPIREMQKRHWIEESNNIDVLEAQFCQFYNIEAVDDEIEMAHAARKSDDYGKVSIPQLAWLCRAQNLSRRMVDVPRYKESHLPKLFQELSILEKESESIAMIPELFRRNGIRFLVVEHIPQTKIDGACFWLDKYSPVTAVSMRYDRIDYFWHTVVHELMHVKKRHGVNKLLLETALVGGDAQPDDDKMRDEKTADKLARQFLIDQKQLEDFVLRHGPLFSRVAIVRFSNLIGVHPGIVVGQLQHSGIIPYTHFRAMLERVRDIITPTALTDGWGQVIAA